MAKDISKTLIVGIGGTGQTVIRDIKKRLLRTYGEVPNLVKFLEFDTDQRKDEDNTPFEYYYKGQKLANHKYQISDQEYLLTPFLGAQLAEHDPICESKINMDEFKKVSARLNNKGAGGYRVCGRVIFLQNSGEIINKLRSTIDELRRSSLSAQEQAERGYNVINGNINVFVISSLAGGTGSSAFMDMSRMLQIAGINVSYNVTAGTDQIFGVFFLPKFFKGKPNTQNVDINAYTALSELDYTLNLNDSQKYPAGCIELAEDNQDYKGYLNYEKRVVYTCVYLVDALTSHSQVNTFDEASSYVASFIAASIAADANAISASFANSNHKMNTVEGKYQNYSGIGYCELRFDRHELVKFLLNRKLISLLEGYKNGATSRASQIVEDFINTNALNEGIKRNAEGNDERAQLNQLTDAIINLTDSRFGTIYLGAVESGKDAADRQATSKTEYLNKIAVAADEFVQAFSFRKEQLISNLRDLLNKQQRGKGFGVFPDFASLLRDSFIDMKNGLEEEIDLHIVAFEGIERELEQIKTSINENSSKGFLGLGSKLSEQEDYLQAYRNKVDFATGDANNPTLALLKVEVARKKEAVALYEEFVRIIDSYYKKEVIETINGSEERITGSYLKIGSLYGKLIRELSAQNNSYKPSKAANKETLKADAYFKEYFENHDAETTNLTLQDQNRIDEYLYEIFTSLPDCDEEKLSEMREKLLNLLPADGDLRKIQDESLSIDQLFIRCFGTFNEINNPNDLDKNPQLKLLSQLETLFDPLWQYVPFSEGLSPDKHMVVGVNDPDFHIFDQANGYSQKINGWETNRQYISLGDPDRIVFMLMETAIPAHALMNANEWANEYNQKKSLVYTFTDKRLENIEMIKPGALDEGEVAWAYGWLFGLISNPKSKQGLRVKPTYGYVTRNGFDRDKDDDCNYFVVKVKNCSDISACHKQFINDQELSNDILKTAMGLLEKNPIDNIIKIKEWVNERKMWSSEVRGKEEKSMSPQEKRVIVNEIKYLAMRFVRLGYGLSLDDHGNVVHRVDDAIANRERELNGNK